MTFELQSSRIDFVTGAFFLKVQGGNSEKPRQGSGETFLDEIQRDCVMLVFNVMGMGLVGMK